MKNLYRAFACNQLSIHGTSFDINLATGTGLLGDFPLILMCVFLLSIHFSAVARGLGTVHTSHRATKEKLHKGEQKLLKSTLDDENISV